MTLTPQQRLEAYEWAREEIQQYSVHSYRIGVCGRLQMWLFHENIPIPLEPNLLFHEFARQKPLEIADELYWWPRNKNGFIQRLAALDRAIELVKEKI